MVWFTPGGVDAAMLRISLMTSQRDSTRNFGGSATFGESLDDALVSCLRGLLSWLHATAGISEE
jgi:hypothetical protein